MDDGVAERAPARGETAARGTTDDGSRKQGGRLGGFRSAIGASSPALLAVSAAAVVGGLLLVIAEFSTVASVDVASGSCEVINDSSPDLADRCELSGFERHGGAFILLGLLAVLMGLGAGIGRSRPAAAALIVIGAVVLALTVLLDLPETDETGAIGRNFEGAEASPGTGLYLEGLAGLLLLASGAFRLMQREPAPEPRQRERTTAG